MKHFEMPENYECKCREGRANDKESEVCQKCVKAGKALDIVLEKAASEVNPEMIDMIMFYMLAVRAKREKDDYVLYACRKS